MTDAAEEHEQGEPKSVPPPDGEGGEPEHRRRLEKVLRDVVRKGLERGIEAGLGTLSKTNHAVGDLLGGGQGLSKEITGYVFGQIDETKNALVRVVAREVREFLEATDLSAELQKALTSLSFEIKTEIRFIPNDSGGVKPEIKTKPVVIARKKKKDGTDEEPGA
jgi:hypothetical protein